MKRITKILILILLIITAVSASVAGFLFIIDPSGSLIGLSVEYINNSPFDSFLIPGIVLLVANGVLNFFAAIYLFLNKINSEFIVIIQGVILCGWIIIQVMMVSEINILHITMFTIGILLILGGLILKKNLKNH